MVSQGSPHPAFDAMTSRLLRRGGLRRAAEELNTTSGPGLEDVLARISAEVTAEASGRIADANAAAISSARTHCDRKRDTKEHISNEWNQPHHN